MCRKNTTEIYFKSRGSVGNCSFVGCSANGRGGAIYFWNDGSVGNCSFVGCSASVYGGAIYFRDGGSMSSVNYCIFDNNKADNGSAIYSISDSVDVGYNFFG